MILFQKKDEKFKHWKNELEEYGIQSDAVDGSPVLAPYVLIKAIVNTKGVDLYVFRYLNDYQSYLKSFVRFTSELAIIVICKIFNVKIWWICHNVDKESVQHHRKLSSLRRRMVASSSTRIFTTSELLIPYAQVLFKTKSIDNISLGFIEENVYDSMVKDKETESLLINWLEKIKGNNKAKVIFCAGSVAEKSLHFERVSSLLDNLNGQGDDVEWYAIVVGTEVKGHDYIFNIPFKFAVSKRTITHYIDYYYRVMDDLSISYTLYEAAHYQKPIITENFGILPDVLRKYNIGYVYEYSERNFFSPCDSNSFIKFSNNNNWKVAAQKISEYFKLDCRSSSK